MARKSWAENEAGALSDTSRYPKLDEVAPAPPVEQKPNGKRKYVVSPAVRQVRKEAQVASVASRMGELVKAGKDESLSPNLKSLAMNMMLMNLPQLDLTDGNDVWARTCQYFEMCSTMDEKPSVEGYALALGVERRTLNKWMNGGTPTLPEDVLKAVSKGYQLLGAQMSSFMLNGKINPIAGIFLMRNNLGYTNVDQVQEEEKPVEEKQVDADEMIRRFKDLPD